MESSSQYIKITFLSDTHLGEDYPIRNGGKRIRRGEDFFRNFEYILNQAKKNKTDFVVHGGDLFFRTKVHPVVVDRVYQIILEFANSGIPIIIVPGNHESSRLPSSLLLQHPNIHIFKKPEVFIFPDKDIAFAGFPFIRGNVRDQFESIQKDLYNQCKDVSIKLMNFHHPVEGTKVNSKFSFRNREDTILMKDISENFDGYLSGHIHPHQILYKKIGAKEIPVIYPGSVERTSFAEKKEIKGYYQINIQKQLKELRIMTKFNTLQSRPMIDIVVENNYSLEQTIDYLVNELSRVEERSIIRIQAEKSEYLNQIKYSFLTSLIPKNCILTYRKNYLKKELA